MINEVKAATGAVDPRSDVQGSSPSGGASAATATSAGLLAAPSDASTFVLSPEVRRWIAIVQEQPEIRPDAVKNAAAKLAKGAYSGSDAADQVAEALLQAID